MNLATLMSRLQLVLTAEERAQFRAEQQNPVQLTGLPVVHRVFIGG